MLSAKMIENDEFPLEIVRLQSANETFKSDSRKNRRDPKSK